MTEKKNNESKWKDYLLKSSLPLEQLVAEKLEKSGVYIAGEYPYIRTNEQNVSTEFSVDLHAFELLAYSHQKDQYWGNLNFLIECKYNYPGVKWVFLPILDSSLQVANSIRCVKELSNKRLAESKSIYTIDNQLKFCSKGVEIHSGGFDSNSILHGLSQLRYGLPNMIAQSMITQKEDQQIHFVCPILVTTANLYIMKTGLDLNAYFSATSLDNVAEKVDALITYQENGPLLHRYSN